MTNQIKIQVLPPLTTKNNCPTGIRSFTLSIYQVLEHFSLIWANGFSLLGIAEALAPCMDQRHSVLGIVFRWFCNFCDSPEYWVALDGISELSCFYEWYWIKRLPTWSSSWWTWCENIIVWCTRST